MRRAGIGKRIAVWLLAAALAAMTLTGCGGSDDAGSTDTEGGGSAVTEGSGEEQQGTAMGRYVEKDVELNGNGLTDWNSRVFQMADGSLLLADNSGFVLRSQDNGGSWIREDLPWLTKMKEDNKYIRCMAFGPDQTAAVLWTQPLEQTDEEEGNGVQLDMNMRLTVVRPDNTEIQTDSPEGQILDSVYIADTGQILVVGYSETMYEVKEDGSLAEFLTVDGGWPEFLRFHGNIMLMDSMSYDVPLLYDLEAKKYIEDEVLEDFVKENFSSRDCYAGRSYDLFMMSGDDDAIYLAGDKGVYRHVLGGSVMEQIIDGSLTTLGNPAYTIMDMLAIKNNEFLVLFTQGKVLRFVYDPDIPARPDERLTVWSLEEKSTIRQAINVFQKANPAVYVDYEIGLTKGASMTRDDVIKNLNTAIMAGDGPDVLVLDDMPMDSYIEKGILADISPVLESMSGEEAVFGNVVDALKVEGKIYVAPCEIQLPYVLGRGSDLDNMTGLSEIADALESIREGKSGDSLLEVPSEKGIMRLFSLASVPAWKTAEGELDRDTIEAFLTQAERMYEAETDGLSEEAWQEWEDASRVYQQYESENGEALEDTDQLRMNGAKSIYMVAGMRQLMAGSMDQIDSYNILTSVMTTEGFADCKLMPMPGQGGRVFWARTLLGINATSDNTALAQDFMKAALGGEVQKSVQGGFPVTRQAILDNYADQWRLYKDNDYVSGSGGLYTDEGQDVTMLIRVPNEAQVNELLQWIESTDTAYLEDQVFEGVVYEEGKAYMRGDKSLEEAMDSIETRLGIYLAE